MKKVLHLAMAVVLLSCMIASCDSGSRYEVRGDQVVYTYWTFSFGRVYDTLPQADVSSFQQVNGWLGHDDRQVFFEAKHVPGADVSTLKPKKYPLFRDNRDYYYKTKAMHVADVESFEIIKWFEHDFWAKDSQRVYFDSLCVEGADVASFKVMSMTVAKDKNHVYYFGRILPLADPLTFEALGKSIYNRDKNHVWCGDSLMTDADASTFVVDDIDRAHDKNGAFVLENRVNEGEQVQ